MFHQLGVSENVVYPIVPNGFADHYPYEKWLFHWENTLFSDKPKWNPMKSTMFFSVNPPLNDYELPFSMGKHMGKWWFWQSDKGNWNNKWAFEWNRGLSRASNTDSKTISEFFNTISGWWFQPLWKILVNGKDYPIYYGKWLKPPTRYKSRDIITCPA